MIQDIPVSRLDQAVYNNAVWCDTVCRAHGQPGEFRSEIWFNPRPTPAYYPNAVTLVGSSAINAQMNVVQQLIKECRLTGFAVKDSYHTLDLTPLGFRPLFDASWLWRPALLPTPAIEIDGIQWATIRGSDALAHWETAWANQPANTEANRRIFLPALLSDPDVVFIAAYRNEQIVAGAVGNRTGDVAGVSNQFAPAGEAPEHYWAGCIHHISAAFPKLPLVGYEDGGSLAVTLALGFEKIGMLRIWASNLSRD